MYKVGERGMARSSGRAAGTVNLRMDFSRREVLDTSAMDWAPSPSGGVLRKPLAREQAERGHATSIVRYEPGARFERHEHPLGEEILVLGNL